MVLHNLATLFDNTNTVSNPEQSDQIVRGVFWQTFAKSCQITNNIAEIRPKISTFFSLNDLSNNGPNTNCVTWTYLGKIQILKGGSGSPENKGA